MTSFSLIRLPTGGPDELVRVFAGPDRASRHLVGELRLRPAQADALEQLIARCPACAENRHADCAGHPCACSVAYKPAGAS